MPKTLGYEDNRKKKFRKCSYGNGDTDLTYLLPIQGSLKYTTGKKTLIDY